jgi:serine/threonine-protein kinase
MDLFEAAVEWPADEVEARLTAIEPDPGVRAEVLRLLEADRRVEAQREVSPPASPGPPDDDPLPRALGPYTLVRVIGSGGFGTVYEAMRPGPEGPSRVAVKRLHAHATTPDDLARFERERYLLASLDSPGIARFVDSGRDEGGRPYLVMELVDGQPIDTYCDARRLGVGARLRMMAAVCRDVQAAHERLVAHLDLKPSNILVGADGRPKIVDFGTSKLLAEPGAVTTTIRLTPHYASPEQLRHEPVSTASDTYALGLILYELATGAWPFGGKGSFVSTADRMLGREAPGRITDTITSEAAERRGTTVARLRSELTGDLEVILQKALAPNPRERYATAGALAADLDALADGRPISARRPTMAYRAAKLVSRHPVVTAAALAAIAVIAAMGGVAWSQQQRALAEGRRARQTVDFLYRMLSAASPENGGRRGMTVRELVERADTGLDAGDDLPIDVQAGVRSVLAYVAFSEGDETAGLDMARRALAEARAGIDPAVRAAAVGNLVLLQILAGRCNDASALAAEWDDAGRRLPATSRARAVYLTGRSRLVSRCDGDPARAEALGREAVAMLPRIAAHDLSRIDRASIVAQHAGHLSDLGRHQDARAALAEGLRLVEGHPDGDTVRLSLLRLQANSAAAEGDYTDAARALEQAVGLAAGRSTPFAEVRLKASWATRLAQAGQRERGLALAREVLEESGRRAAEFAASRWMILIDVADAMMEAGECARVPALLDEARTTAGGGMPVAWRVVSLKVDALCRAHGGDAEGARVRAAEALQLGATLLKAAPSTERRLRAIAGPAAP